MTRYHKKLAHEKVQNILKSYKYIIIGCYDSGHKTIWKNIKANCDFYIPKNSICRLSFNVQQPSSDIENMDQKERFQDVLGGSIFILGANKLVDLSPALSVLSQNPIAIYGGFFKDQFINFADVKELNHLLKETVSCQNAHMRLYSQMIRPQQTLSGVSLSCFFKLYKGKDYLS